MFYFYFSPIWDLITCCPPRPELPPRRRTESSLNLVGSTKMEKMWITKVQILRKYLFIAVTSWILLYRHCFAVVLFRLHCHHTNTARQHKGPFWSERWIHDVVKAVWTNQTSCFIASGLVQSAEGTVKRGLGLSGTSRLPPLTLQDLQHVNCAN